MKKIILSLILGLCIIPAQAQMPGDRNVAASDAMNLSPGIGAASDAMYLSPGMAGANVVVAGSFWSNWFVQMGLDMTLQNPYGYDFSKVFPNGKTFGLDLAVGKWFTHQVGVRGKFNWENKLPLLENDHANWLAPFD